MLRRASTLGRAFCRRSYSSAAPTVAPFRFTELFPQEYGSSGHKTEYRKITSDYVSVEKVTTSSGTHEFLKVEPEALTLLTSTAMRDIAHLLRPAHLQQLSNILKDPEASDNDRFVALELLKNANIAAALVLPGCQDTVSIFLFDFVRFLFVLFRELELHSEREAIMFLLMARMKNTLLEEFTTLTPRPILDILRSLQRICSPR
jgi:hypothetical protein